MEELRGELRPGQTAPAVEFLVEAEKSYERQGERAAGAERRATTLQGFISLAVTFVLANGGLLLGANGVRGDGWRIAFGAGLLTVAFTLIVSALWATRAVFTTHVWSRPYAVSKVRGRMQESEADAKLELAAALLYAAERGAEIAEEKIAHMKDATVWFRLALILLLGLALLFLIYVLAGPAPVPAVPRSPAHG